MRRSEANRAQDISARSPIPTDNNTRQSLDSARLPRFPRSAIESRHFERQPATAEAEETFEDVGLDDKKDNQVKKRGFFSKFGDGDNNNSMGGSSSGTGTTGGGITGRFHIGGRKRGMSGGEELGNIKRPGTAEGKVATVKE